MDATLQDIRYAIRSLRRAPGLTVTVVGTLAMSIALFTTFFSFLNTVRFRGHRGAVAAGFGAVALISYYLPARRAARLDQVVALRS